MAHASDLMTEDIDSYLNARENKSLLRLITCGSVDDGKSTLIGRLLYDAKLIFEDHLAALEAESKKSGTVADGLDFALLVDGLQAEREQGITIDVAYRFFSTDKRKFIIADCPGHEQYTRNMVTGASTADLAILLVDARSGVKSQTCRHGNIAALMGIGHVILAVNKMDLIGYDPAIFEKISADFAAFAAKTGLSDVQAIPLSARDGDNVAHPSKRMNWYDGPTLIDHLQSVQVAQDAQIGPLRMPVQWVNRPDHSFRGFSGTLAGGSIAVGEPILALPSQKQSRVARIVTRDGDLDRAIAGQSVTLTLQDEIDISRGDLICTPQDAPALADHYAACLIWMDEQPLLPGRRYVLKSSGLEIAVQITRLKYRLQIDTLEQAAADRLQLNEIGQVNLGLEKAVALDAYHTCRQNGSFILVDRFTNRSVAAGMIDFALRRGTHLMWQELDVDQDAHAALKAQKPVVLWFTGLSGSGKSTVANLVEKKLHGEGRHTFLLDGDNVRHGLNRDLGFTDADRVENIRRIAEVSKLFVQAGLIILVSFISPFRSERRMARELLGEGEFVEIFINTPLEICEWRDPKGLYQKARAGQIRNFTGIDSAYEPPVTPEIEIAGETETPEQAAGRIVTYLHEGAYLG